MDICSYIHENDDNDDNDDNDNDNDEDDDDLCESIKSTNLNDDPTTVYISGLLERLTNEMTIKKKDDESVNIILPNWFQTLHPKYQKMLFTILEPILQDCLYKST